ncbi:hypothetical protein BIY26_22750 [Brenneria goodwinii]|uniref:Uncharacterized protein n=1 Tax=Brenneria goodwinii TaxID=1109412 RepID=A0AAE8EM67_9GAMM|nr:hypothetical protein AWC36_21415 [Brenneria goodwinii]RLM15751.1 hypothetical protein BIY28_23480 [Brenneria goodwinii]RLM15769.1 hypothetical protein BIY26_22750 [Brenneria goodwinii]
MLIEKTQKQSSMKAASIKYVHLQFEALHQPACLIGVLYDDLTPSNDSFLCQNLIFQKAIPLLQQN